MTRHGLLPQWQKEAEPRMDADITEKTDSKMEDRKIIYRTAQPTCQRRQKSDFPVPNLPVFSFSSSAALPVFVYAVLQFARSDNKSTNCSTEVAGRIRKNAPFSGMNRSRARHYVI